MIFNHGNYGSRLAWSSPDTERLGKLPLEKNNHIDSVMLFSFLYTVFAALTSSKTKGAHFFGLWCTLLGFELVKVAPCINFTITSSSHRIVERGVSFWR